MNLFWWITTRKNLKSSVHLRGIPHWFGTRSQSKSHTDSMKQSGCWLCHYNHPVGGDAARVADEQVALRYAFWHKRLPEPAALFAMRSIPVLTEYCRLIREKPNHLFKVFNFTNPAGLVSQALRYEGFRFYLWNLWRTCQSAVARLRFEGCYAGPDRGRVLWAQSPLMVSGCPLWRRWHHCRIDP